MLKTLADWGRYAEAEKLMLESGLRQKFANDPLNLLRLRWVEAKILAGHDRLEDAERALAEVRVGFHEHQLAYVAAVAGLDQAEVMLRQGKEVHGLARDILARFREHEVQPEAIQALLAYEVFCSEKAVTVTVTQRIRDFLGRLQDHPGMRFDLGLVLFG